MPPTTVPLIRMYCRSAPDLKLEFVHDASKTSQDATTPAMNPPISRRRGAMVRWMASRTHPLKIVTASSCPCSQSPKSPRAAGSYPIRKFASLIVGL